MKQSKGFTLIELLVVIAIIGLLSTLAVVALGSAREKSRDAKRLSDVKQIQTALELYYTDQSSYPTTSTSALGAGSFACLGTSGFGAAGCANAYMQIVPANPTPGGASYAYSSASGTTYSITFSLEGSTGGLAAGSHTASQGGIQ
jgi:type II secretion system protein G